MVRLSFKQVEQKLENINKSKGITETQKGYLRVQPSYEYYELVIKTQDNHTGINQLVRGTLRDVDDYIEYSL